MAAGRSGRSTRARATPAPVERLTVIGNRETLALIQRVAIQMGARVDAGGVTGAAALPTRPSTSARLVMTAAAPERADEPFFDFMTMRQHPFPRPQVRGIAASTARNYDRRVRQIGREIWSDEDQLVDGPPDWEKVLAWRNKQGEHAMARLDGHRKGLIWLAAFWNQYGIAGQDLPPFIAQRWATPEAVSEAQAAGEMRRYAKHFDLPGDIERLLAATPHEDALGYNRKSRRKLRAARYLDDLFHTLVLVGFYTLSRQSDLAALRIENYQPSRGGFIGWHQPKKHNKTRDVVIPETFVLQSKVDASADHYWQHVRPRVALAGEPSGAFFLNSAGRPFNEDTMRNFLTDAIHRVLGPKAPGPHGLRRGGATWRYHHGWTLKEVAALMDDTEGVAEGYLDRAWLQHNEKSARKSQKGRPAVPRIRSAGKTDENEGGEQA